jgi:hypothetical protein
MQILGLMEISIALLFGLPQFLEMLQLIPTDQGAMMILFCLMSLQQEFI